MLFSLSSLVPKTKRDPDRNWVSSYVLGLEAREPLVDSPTGWFIPPGFSLVKENLHGVKSSSRAE
jgi:hypothetical protein